MLMRFLIYVLYSLKVNFCAFLGNLKVANLHLILHPLTTYVNCNIFNKTLFTIKIVNFRIEILCPLTTYVNCNIFNKKLCTLIMKIVHFKIKLLRSLRLMLIAISLIKNVPFDNENYAL